MRRADPGPVRLEAPVTITRAEAEDVLGLLADVPWGIAEPGFMARAATLEAKLRHEFDIRGRKAVRVPTRTHRRLRLRERAGPGERQLRLESEAARRTVERWHGEGH